MGSASAGRSGGKHQLSNIDRIAGAIIIVAIALLKGRAEGKRYIPA